MTEKKRRVGRNFIEGWACPKCGQYEHFWVVGLAWFHVFDEGTDEVEEVEWEDSNLVKCWDCDWVGTVLEVTVPEGEWAGEEEEEKDDQPSK